MCKMSALHAWKYDVDAAVNGALLEFVLAALKRATKLEQQTKVFIYYHKIKVSFRESSYRCS